MGAPGDLSYLDRAVLRIIDDVYRRTRVPVRTIAVSAHLGKGDRNCRRYLTAIERRGLVLRVGERGGWLPLGGVEPSEIAAAYAALRRRAAALEDQLAALRAPVRCGPVTPPPRYGEVDALFVQPPLPGFADLAPAVYLN